MTAASHFLTDATTLECPHGAPVTGSTRNARVKVDQNFVLRSTDTFLVAGCSHTIGNIPHPCVRVQWDVHAERHQSHGDPSLTEDSVGYCLAADGAMQGIVVVSSTQIRGGAT